jgi:hypothetical protein
MFFKTRIKTFLSKLKTKTRVHTKRQTGKKQPGIFTSLILTEAAMIYSGKGEKRRL